MVPPGSRSGSRMVPPEWLEEWVEEDGASRLAEWVEEGASGLA